MRRAPKRLLLHFVRNNPHDSSPFSRCTPVRRDFSVVLGQVVVDGLLPRPDGFYANPCRNIETLAESPVQALPSRQRNAQEMSGLEEAFESASALEKVLGAFRKMESCFDEKELGLMSLKVGLKLDKEGEDPMKVILGKLGEDGPIAAEDVRPVHHAVLLELANVKTALGWREEAIRDLRKCLEIKELTFEEDCEELGKADRDVAEGYVTIFNFKEALLFATKALEIHRSFLGNNSVEVAEDRRLIGVIYSGLEECFCQNRIVAVAHGLSTAGNSLECAAERLEGSFGSQHFGLGYIYNNLRAAYLELDRPQSAAQMFAVAKDIMDVALGPHHVDSIEACPNLSKAYGAMGR